MTKRYLAITVLLTLCGCSTLFPKNPGPHLQHFAQEAPAVGTLAPNIRVHNLAGEEVALHDLVGERPIVLQLGSYTCPVFRYRRFYMQPLREQYAEQVRFLVLYTTEAHPVGSASPYINKEWVPWHNKLARVGTRESGSALERREQASKSQTLMQSNAEFLVDDMNNSGWSTYGRAPSAAFLIDRDGYVRARQVWVEPKQLKQAIDALLSDG